MSVYITDINGNIINYKDIIKYPFIIIYFDKIYDYIAQINQDFNFIYKINNINNLLHNEHFYPFGNFIIPQNITKYAIILANIQFDIIKFPTDFVKILSISDSLHLWKPIAPNNYMSLGYLISSEKPSIKSIVTINKNKIKKYNGIHFESKLPNVILTNANEFYILNISNNDYYTIDGTINISEGKLVNLISADKPWFDDFRNSCKINLEELNKSNLELKQNEKENKLKQNTNLDNKKINYLIYLLVIIIIFYLVLIYIYF